MKQVFTAKAERQGVGKAGTEVPAEVLKALPQHLLPEYVEDAPEDSTKSTVKKPPNDGSVKAGR